MHAGDADVDQIAYHAVIGHGLARKAALTPDAEDFHFTVHASSISVAKKAYHFNMYGVGGEMKSEQLKVRDLVQVNGQDQVMLVHDLDPGEADVLGIPDAVSCIWEDDAGDQWGVFERRHLKVVDKAELPRWARTGR